MAQPGAARQNFDDDALIARAAFDADAVTDGRFAFFSARETMEKWTGGFRTSGSNQIMTAMRSHHKAIFARRHAERLPKPDRARQHQQQYHPQNHGAPDLPPVAVQRGSTLHREAVRIPIRWEAHPYLDTQQYAAQSAARPTRRRRP